MNHSRLSLPSSIAPLLKKNGFIMDKFIGKGAFGNVYTCSRNFGKKKYAAKVVEFGDDIKVKWQTENEIEILKEVCNHNNIVSFHGATRNHSNIVMILELIPGPSFLEGILSWPRFNENDIKTIAKQLLDALKFCHSKRIIHRDICPDNLLWYDVPTMQRPHAVPAIKLIDFNLSRKIPEHSNYLHADALGNPSYMAPECLRDESISSFGSDVWSVGILLFLLMGGYPPFFNDNYNHLLQNITEANFVFPNHLWNHVTEDGKDVIKELLTADVEMRPTIDEIMTHKWFHTKVSSATILNTSKTMLADLHQDVWIGQRRLKGFLRNLNERKNQKNHRKYSLVFKERQAFIPEDNMLKMPIGINEMNFYQQKVMECKQLCGLDISTNLEVKKQSFHW